MAHRLLVSLTLLGASLAVFGPVLAQEPPDASKNPPTSPAATLPAPAAQESDSSAAPAPSSMPAASPDATPGVPAASPDATPGAPAASPAPAAPATPSADTIKKARMAGYHPETKNGKTMFCQETANIGTRFPTKKCLDEQQIAGIVDIQRENKDSLTKPFMCAGSGCAGH